MAATIQVGVLRAQLTADTAKFTAGFREADATVKKFTAANKRGFDPMIKGMSEAGRAASASGKMIAGMSLAGRQAAEAQAAAAQAAIGYGARLRGLGGDALSAVKSTGLLTGSVGSLVLGLGGLSIIGTITGLLGGMAGQALEASGNLVDLSGKTGQSIKSLQEMDFVAKQTGSTLEAFAKATFQLGVRVEAGSKPVNAAVRQLGLSLKDLQSLKPEDQFAKIADALGKIEDPQERNRLGLILFGKTFEQVAPAIAEGYGKLASQATIAGDAQVRALDAAGDAWTRFKDDAHKATIGVLGSLVLVAKGFGDVSWGERLKAIFGGPGGIAQLGGIAMAATETAQATTQAGKAAATAATSAESYSKQLAKVRAELAALTPEQRKEIAAAQALGVSTDDLEAKYGLTDGALRVLTAQTVANEKATKSSAKAMKDAGEEAKKAAEAYGDFLAVGKDAERKFFEGGLEKERQRLEAQIESSKRRGQAEADGAQASHDIEEQRAEFAIEQAKLNGATWEQVYAMEKALADQRLQRVIDQSQLEFEIRTSWIDRTTEHGEAEYQALKKAHDLAVQGMVERHQQAEELKRDELDRTHNVWRRSIESAKTIAQGLTSTVAQGFVDMVTKAQSFKQAFVGVWQSIKQSLLDIFGDILHSFVTGLLDGMLGAITGRKGGFTSAFGGLLGGAGGGIPGLGGGGGGLLGGLLGGASGGLFAAGGASSGLASGAAINATTAGLAGGGAGAGGAGAAITGLLTNPITIAAGAAALLSFAIIKKGLFRGGWEGIEGNRRRDQFQAQFGGPGTGPDSGFQKIAEFLTATTGQPGGGSLFRDLQSGDKQRFESAEQAIAELWNRKHTSKVQAFKFGGLVQGFGAVPAIVHGGEGVLSTQGMQNVGGAAGLQALNSGAAPNASIVNINVSVTAWDSIDAARWFRTQGIPEIKQAILLNTGGLSAALQGAT